MKDHTWNSIEEEEAAYLLLPYTEESYQAISAILDKRLKEFLEAEFEDDPNCVLHVPPMESRLSFPIGQAPCTVLQLTVSLKRVIKSRWQNG